jgi:hypothetical protein
MKLTQPVLNAALRGLRLARPRRTTMPVLECVRLTANGRDVALTVTDLDQLVTYTGELAEDSTPVTRLVPFDLLQRIAKEMPREAILAFTQPGQIACVVGNATTYVPFDQLPPEDFPFTAAVEGSDIELPPAALLALQQARFVSSDNLARRSLNSVCLEPTGVVATDGRQLFHANTMSLPLAGARLLPPHKTLGLFDPATPALLRLSSNEQFLGFTLRQGNWTWQAKLLDEKFPDWRKHVPSRSEECTKVSLTAGDIARLRQIVGLIPRDPRRTPSMALVVRGQKLLAVTRHAGNPQSHELPTATVAGPDCHAWFNPEFLLRALDFGFVNLHLRDSASPLIACDEHRDYVFMPQKLDDTELPEALRPPTPAAAEQNNPPPQTEPPNPPNTTEEPKMSQTSTATAPASAPEAATPPPPVNGQPHSTTNGAADQFLTQWQEARDAVRVGLDKLEGLRASVRNLSREHRDLQKEHETLKRNVRAVQKLEV